MNRMLHRHMFSMRPLIVVMTLLMLFAAHSVHAQELMIRPILSGNLEEEECVFIAGFAKAYENFSAADLGVNDKEAFLRSAFEDVRTDLYNPNCLHLHALLDDQVVGFVEFKIEDTPEHIYIAQLVVDPAHWGQGIGSSLLYSLLHYFPSAKQISLIARRINKTAADFYKSHGFYESLYMHEGYDPNKYIGFECDIATFKERGHPQNSLKSE